MSDTEEAAARLYWSYNLPLQVWPKHQNPDDETSPVVDARILNYMPRKERCMDLDLSEVLSETGLSREQFFEVAAVHLENLARLMREAGKDPTLQVYYHDAGMPEPRALAPNLASARTAGHDSQNTTEQVTKAVDVASESVAGRAPVAQSGEDFEDFCNRLWDGRHEEDPVLDVPKSVLKVIWRAAAPIADEARDAIREALIRAERKLSAYVGVCSGDKELTNTVLPMVRAAIAAERGETKL